MKTDPLRLKAPIPGSMGVVNVYFYATTPCDNKRNVMITLKETVKSISPQFISAPFQLSHPFLAGASSSSSTARAFLSHRNTLCALQHITLLCCATKMSPKYRIWTQGTRTWSAEHRTLSTQWGNAHKTSSLRCGIHQRAHLTFPDQTAEGGSEVHIKNKVLRHLFTKLATKKKKKHKRSRNTQSLCETTLQRHREKSRNGQWW